MSAADEASALLDELLGPLRTHFLGAGAAYRAYLDHGRSFLLANSLRRINLAARTLLVARGHLLPVELQACATALIGHYDVWLRLWGEQAQRLQPAPGDAFAFENEVTYPREAEQRLMRLYEDLRRDARSV